MIADVEIGEGNLPNLEAAAAADELVIVEERPIEERNYTGVRGEELYLSLKQQAHVTSPGNLLETLDSVLEGRG